jgi:hypothetical protein
LNRRIKTVAAKIKILAGIGALLVVLAGTVSCRTAAPLPPEDFSDPGWRMMSGQALWKPSRQHAELAADLMFATNSTGDYLVQLTKDPLPLVTAEVIGGQWQIQFQAGRYSRSGRGAPPARFPWFQLPQVLQGAPPGPEWRFKRVNTNAWRLEDPETGETLEGVFFP